ncbi:hypothetical protein GOBAR_AA17993 [Gossypium barbadense]|uniref:DUF4283 domain-containing protein n=1 Tax=Gossypium barbadense TaxID=3634 RepID=A0A2P5XHC6_GOSBA|nr:hypothetical protein GOBAR_AA17993 [Gossypium barbadense]
MRVSAEIGSDGDNIGMERGMVALSLEGEDEEGWQDDLGGEESEEMDDLCVVSNFLTAGVIQFKTMKSTLANLWHPHGDDLRFGR